MEKELFYSPDEKIAFLVTGYAGSGYVNDTIKRMRECAKRFKAAVGTDKNLRMLEVTKSSRYKYMQVYWTDGINKAPKGAFVIGGGEYKWTMMEWLQK